MSGGDGRPVTTTARLSLWVLLALTIALVVIAGLRFARMDVLGTSFFASDRYYTFETDEGEVVENLNIDIAQYLAMIEDARGVDGAFEKQTPYPEFASEDDAVQGPVVPFIRRPLIPWLAAPLPFPHQEAFATVNLVLLVAGLWLLVDALHRSGRSPVAQLFGGALYTFALPVLVFATSLYIDGAVMALMVLGYWLVVRRYWWALVVFFPASALAKESLLALAPVAAWAWHSAGHRLRDPRFVVGASLAGLGWLGVTVAATVAAPDPVLSYNVWPKLTYLAWNVGNPVSALFFAVGLAPVLLPALALLRSEYRDLGPRGLLNGRCGTDLIGLLVLAALNLYSIVSTDLTLRTGWLVFPFAISLSAMWLDDRWGSENALMWTHGLGRRRSHAPT